MHRLVLAGFLGFGVLASAKSLEVLVEALGEPTIGAARGPGWLSLHSFDGIPPWAELTWGEKLPLEFSDKEWLAMNSLPDISHEEVRRFIPFGVPGAYANARWMNHVLLISRAKQAGEATKVRVVGGVFGLSHRPLTTLFPKYEIHKLQTELLPAAAEEILADGTVGVVLGDRLAAFTLLTKDTIPRMGQDPHGNPKKEYWGKLIPTSAYQRLTGLDSKPGLERSFPLVEFPMASLLFLTHKSLETTLNAQLSDDDLLKATALTQLFTLEEPRFAEFAGLGQKQLLDKLRHRAFTRKLDRKKLYRILQDPLIGLDPETSDAEKEETEESAALDPQNLPVDDPALQWLDGLVLGSRNQSIVAHYKMERALLARKKQNIISHRLIENLIINLPSEEGNLELFERIASLIAIPGLPVDLLQGDFLDRLPNLWEYAKQAIDILRRVNCYTPFVLENLASLAADPQTPEHATSELLIFLSTAPDKTRFDHDVVTVHLAGLLSSDRKEQRHAVAVVLSKYKLSPFVKRNIIPYLANPDGRTREFVVKCLMPRDDGESARDRVLTAQLIAQLRNHNAAPLAAQLIRRLAPLGSPDKEALLSMAKDKALDPALRQNLEVLIYDFGLTDDSKLEPLRKACRGRSKRRPKK